MFYDFNRLVLVHIRQFFTEYSFQDIVLTPYYIYMTTLEWALHLYSQMQQHPIIAAVAVMVVVMIRITLSENESASQDTLTFINIENPDRKYFNFIRTAFWMFFAPFYPLYFWATKGTMYLIVAYLLPYLLLRRLFDRYYFVREPERLSTMERYEKLNS